MVTLEPEPKEMVRYFSEFLGQVDRIIQSIKQHTYQLVGVYIPNPTLLTINQSMASVISNTHKTFDNLKRIEAVLKGLANSKQRPQPCTPVSHYPSVRSRSVENNIFFYPNHPTRLVQTKSSIPQTGADSRTIKKGQIPQKCSSPNHQTNLLDHQKVAEADQFLSLAGEWRQAPEKQQTGGGLGQEEDEKTVRLSGERGDRGTVGANQSQNWRKTVPERVRGLIGSNKSAMSRIMERNMECLRLVRSVKKECLLK